MNATKEIVMIKKNTSIRRTLAEMFFHIVSLVFSLLDANLIVAFVKVTGFKRPKDRRKVQKLSEVRF